LFWKLAQELVYSRSTHRVEVLSQHCISIGEFPELAEDDQGTKMTAVLALL
jgi:hypothetical protein